MKVPTVRLKAAVYQLIIPSSVVEKLLPTMFMGAMVWTRPEMERNWAMQTVKMRRVSRAGEKGVVGNSAS